MLEFSDFLNEARSRAAEKADRLALVSDNHGGWVDRSGRIVARTVNGDLEFIKKKSPKTDTPEPNTKRLPKTAQYQQKKPGKPAELPAPKPPKEQPPAPEVDKDQLKMLLLSLQGLIPQLKDIINYLNRQGTLQTVKN